MSESPRAETRFLIVAFFVVCVTKKSASNKKHR
nr:MAG TPA: hypothetical protein [Caudoviricetes sp.]